MPQSMNKTAASASYFILQDNGDPDCCTGRRRWSLVAASNLSFLISCVSMPLKDIHVYKVFCARHWWRSLEGLTNYGRRGFWMVSMLQAVGTSFGFPPGEMHRISSSVGFSLPDGQPSERAHISARRLAPRIQNKKGSNKVAFAPAHKVMAISTQLRPAWSPKTRLWSCMLVAGEEGNLWRGNKHPTCVLPD